MHSATKLANIHGWCILYSVYIQYIFSLDGYSKCMVNDSFIQNVSNVLESDYKMTKLYVANFTDT